MFKGGKFDNHFYLALCYFFKVGFCNSPQYPVDLSLFQNLYKYLLLCFQDPHQECCLVCLIFLCCFCRYIAPLFQDKEIFSSNLQLICFTITFQFLILCYNLVYALCKSFNLFTEFMEISIEHNFSFKIQDLLN